MHDPRQVHSGFDALLHGDLYQASAHAEHLEIARRVGRTHDIEDQVDVAELLGEIELLVVDGPFGSE